MFSKQSDQGYWQYGQLSESNQNQQSNKVLQAYLRYGILTLILQSNNLLSAAFNTILRILLSDKLDLKDSGFKTVNFYATSTGP